MNERGFTIVELLIVIVVIGILAGISITSYNGITDRARLTAAKSAAAAVAQKAELYLIETSDYPTNYEDLTGAGAIGQIYQVNNITFSETTLAEAPSDPATLHLTKCDATDGATGGQGNEIMYWDYATGTVASIDRGLTTACTPAI
jgi:prepilin-type N-terminal cleavage/methylation domain-containing protein